jgi:hypothetical protein
MKRIVVAVAAVLAISGPAKAQTILRIGQEVFGFPSWWNASCDVTGVAVLAGSSSACGRVVRNFNGYKSSSAATSPPPTQPATAAASERAQLL